MALDGWRRPEGVAVAASASEGHPDKLCDQIAEAIVDAGLRTPERETTVDVLLGAGAVVVTGAVAPPLAATLPNLVRDVVREAGYHEAEVGLDPASVGVLVATSPRPRPWLAPVSSTGYACDETAQLVPTPVDLAHRLARRLDAERRAQRLFYLGPWADTHVMVEYRGGRPWRVRRLALFVRTRVGVEPSALDRELRQHVVEPVVPPTLVDAATEVLVVPEYVTPLATTSVVGLSGRRWASDSYGSLARGDSAVPVGRAPSSPERLATYAARYLAKNVVGAGLARRCAVSLVYEPRRERPTMARIDTFDTGKLADDAIEGLVGAVVDLTLDGLAARFEVREPLFRAAAVYGAFGREERPPPWERLDLAPALRHAVGLPDPWGSVGS
ncbi:MAG TPA: methionine adenosyltransferase domain-containing protein [Chloroflexota bacterium]